MKRLVVAISIFATARFSSAATFFVPQNFATISAALSAAHSGDVINVNPGTYTQNLDFGGKAIALRSVGGPAVTTISVNGGTGVSIGGAAEITGFTITGANEYFGAGISVSGTGTLIKGNIFKNNIEKSGGYGAAIGGNSSSPTIDGNLFLNNMADGQYLSGVVSFLNTSSPTIQNNVFINNPTRAIDFVLPAGSNPKVVNNTFVGNTVAIKYGSFTPAQFSNNILYGNDTGFILDYPNQLPTFDHNLVYNNGVNYSNIADPTGSFGNISVDPHFVSGADFHLQATSPAINAGSALNAPTLDFDGHSRSIPDLGAYEFVPEPSAFSLLAIVAGTQFVTRRRNKRG